MAVEVQPWETNLLDLAHDAWSSVIHAFNAQVDAAQLRRAYQHCARLTAQQQVVLPVLSPPAC